MKKQFLLSAFAVALAVSGVYASNRFADVYYPGGDSSCSTPLSITQSPCPIGVNNPCLDENNEQQHFYRINGAGECLPLTKQ